MTTTTEGHCLCGAVELQGRGTPKITVCHCSQCRRWAGGIAVGIMFEEGLDIVKADGLTWYESSEWAERGFCKVCGTNLLYRMKSDPETYYPQAGTFDLPEGQEIHEHIFIDAKPDYYDFKGDAPRLTEAETLAQYQAGEGQE